MNVFEMHDLVADLIIRVRLPPQMKFHLAPKYDHDDVRLSIIGRWPDVGDPTREETVWWTLSLDQCRETVDFEKAVLLMIKGAVYHLWGHELDEWFTLDGKHIREPHPDKAQVFR